VVVDAFTYNGEDDLLKIRLEFLYDFVDRFVVVEADKTFTGIKKTKKFNPDAFGPWARKISYHFISGLSENPLSPWDNEIAQRNALSLGFCDLKDEDIIILSDLDEIPNPGAIRGFDSAKFIYGCLIQSLHYYRLGLQVYDRGMRPVEWNKSKIITYKNFKRYFRDLSELRWEKYRGPFRSLKRVYLDNNRQLIKNAGWHFTYMMPPDKILEKLKSYSHVELLTPQNNSIDNLEDLIKKGILVTGGEDILVQSDIESQFPLGVTKMAEFKRLR